MVIVMDQILGSDYNVELRNSMDNVVYSETSDQDRLVIRDERVESHKMVIWKNGY